MSIKDDFQQASFQWPAWLIEAALFFIFSIFCWFSEIWNENKNLPWLIWKNAGASTMKVQLIVTVARHGQTIISKKTWRKRAALLLITKIYAPKFAIKTFSRINKAQVSLEIIRNSIWTWRRDLWCLEKNRWGLLRNHKFSLLKIMVVYILK